LRGKKKINEDRKMVVILIWSGQDPVPEDTFEDEYRDLCTKLFDEIEEKKHHYKRLEEAAKNRYRDELEARRTRDHYKLLTEEEWEASRSERVNSW
jgi:DnaJ family protein C protein 8